MDTSKGCVCVRFRRTFYFLVINVYGSGVSSYTNVLFINGYEHTAEICCNCMDGKMTSLFDSQFLAKAFNKKH